MFLVEFLRFLSGYIKFTGTGGFSERFINLCSVHNIPLWDVTYFDGFFEARTTIDGYLKIAVCARNSGVKVKRIRSTGMPFILNRLKPRIGLLIGTIFCVILFTVLSGKVWIIQVSGNETIATEEIIEATKKSGLSIGMDTDDISAVQLSLNTCKETPGASWIAVRINGCCVYIDVTESTGTPEIESKEGAYNLVATKDAQVVLSECYRGTSQTKLFSSVMKGDILISGAVDNKDETTSLVHASGYVVGKTETKITSQVNTNMVTIDYIPIQKVSTLNFFGISIPFGKAPAKYSRCFTKTKSFSADDRILPINLETKQFYSIKQKNKAVSSETAKMIAMSDFLNSASQFVEGKQLIESQLNITQNEKYVSVSGDFVCYENIGKQVILETEYDEQR